MEHGDTILIVYKFVLLDFMGIQQLIEIAIVLLIDQQQICLLIILLKHGLLYAQFLQ